MVLHSPWLFETWTSIYSIFGVKNGTLYLAKKEEMIWHEKYLRSQLKYILKHDSGRKTKWQLYKIWE